MTETVKVGGAIKDGWATTTLKNAARTYMASLGYKAEEYDLTISLTPQRVPQEQFFAGDVYSYKYMPYGNEYTYVFDGTKWTGEGMTSKKMRVAIRSGMAYKCKLVRA